MGETMKKTHDFSFFSNEDKLELSGLAVIPDGDLKGVLQIVHGMCEYKERYLDFMQYMAGEGFLCIIHDHRGHGKSIESMEDLGFFYEGGFQALVEDTHQLTELVKEQLKEANSRKHTENEKIPYYLLGHSMGSLVARCYMKKYDYEIDKLIVMGSPSKLPGMTMGVVLTDLMAKIKGEHNHSKLLDYMVVNSHYEKRFASEKTVHAWVCSDKEVVKRYNEDPFCNYCFTINGYQNLVRLTKETYSPKNWEMQNPDIPILFMSGKNDPCAVSPVDFGKAIHFMKDRGYTNVKGRFYKGLRHEILNEKSKNRVYRDIYEFLSGEDAI